MSFKNAKIDNIKCRVMRISFTGEHSYEINIQANYGEDLMGRNAWKQVKNLILLLTVLRQCTY